MIGLIYGLMAKVGITEHQDKVLHFIAGFTVGGVTVYLFPLTLMPLFATVIVAGGKELYDAYVKGSESDFFDFFVTLVGGWIGITLVGSLL